MDTRNWLAEIGNALAEPGEPVESLTKKPWEYRRIGASALVTIHAYLALANPWNFEENYGNSR